MSLQSWGEEFEKRPLWFLTKAAVLLAAVGVAVTVIGFTCNPWKQAGRIVNRTIDADNVLYNYEWFKQRYQDIQAVDAKVKSANLAVLGLKTELGSRDEWKRQDREEVQRLSTIHLGLQHQRNDLVAEYNARSKMANRSIFRSGELPESISIE